MAQARAVIDLPDIPELKRIVEAVRASREPIVVRIEGEEVAEITPLRPTRHRSKRAKTEADYEAFRSTFGAWKDVDGEQLKATLKAARGSKRRPVEF